MSKIDKHGSTWRAVEKFIESERADCLAFLIADRDSEKQRGALLMLDRLEALVDPDRAQPEEPIQPLRSI
tara:strand:+ start:975 stop:1184 length:210 start_codon:yes stop_codon:yes gene_type:complete